MRSVSTILSSLIVLAEDIITRPAGALQHSARVAELGEAVRTADARLQEGRPATSAAIVMVTALEQFLLDDGLGRMWLVIAGASLPLLREESFIALRNEREEARS